MSTFARLCCSVLFFSFAALAAPAQQTLRVPEDFPTIQTAIDAAHTGDTVSVGPGTWFVNLTLDTKEITLISTAGSATTTLDGGHLGPVVTITNTPGIATVVSGFTVQNGSPLGSSSASLSVGPAGVLISSAGAQILNNTFQKNAGINVGVIKGTINLVNNQISTASTASGACSSSSGSAPLNPSTGIYLSGATTISLPATPLPFSPPSTLSGNTIFGDGTRCSGIGVQAVNVTPKVLLNNNVLRNNSLGLSASNSPFELVQSLLYDNVSGALSIATPLIAHPSTDPATTLLVNNTIVNNLTSPDPQISSIADVVLTGTVAQIAFRNNILLGTTPHPVLTCETQTPSANDTPLILDHNDVFNSSAGPTLIGDCTPTISSPLSVNGNLSADPRLTGSTDLHPQAGSPVLDAGFNSGQQSPTDLDGNPRTTDATGRGYPVIDLGAYERSATASTASPTFLDVVPYPIPATPTDSGSVPTLAPITYVTLPGSVTVLGSIHGSTTTPVSSGTVTLLRDGSAVATATPGSDGSLSFSLPLPTPGVVTLSAKYTPSAGLAPATSPVLYILVEEKAPPATTTLSLTASPTTQVLNQPVTLTIHLGSTTTSSGTTTAGPVPPGAVTISEGSTILTSFQPDPTGSGTYTIPHPAAGPHTYTVTYAGTSDFSAATATTSITITLPIATALTAAATPNPAPLNAPVTCTATVAAASGPAPTGTVIFTDGATSEGSIRLTDSAEQGIATLALSNLSLGLHIITVVFQPDPAFSASRGTCTVNVGGNATRTTLTSSKNPATTTDTVSYTVSVTQSGSTTDPAAPTGSVTLSEGNTLLASAALLAGPANSGNAALSVALSTPGLHLLTATYVPATAANFTSFGTLTETITAPPVITTVLSAAPDPAIIGQTVVLSATLSSQAPLPASASLTFTDGGNVLGSAPVSISGTATLSISTLSLGTHQISAILHTSDTPAVRSTSNLVNILVTVLPTTLALAVSPNAASAATPVTLTASLAPTSALPTGAVLSGTVTFFDGDLPLGISSLSADGHASFATSALATGTHLLSATFPGNDLLSPASSVRVRESIVINPTTTVLSVTPASSTAFAPVTLAAHVSSSTSPARINTLACPPTCVPIAVSFFANSANGTLTLGTVAVDASGDANLTITPVTGTYSISAAFSGSTLFAASASPSSSLAVTPARAALTLTANPNPVYQHGSVALTAALTTSGIPPSALTGTVTFLEGSTVLSTTSLAAAQNFSYAPGAVGVHALTAIFSGNASLSGASATGTVTVLPSDFVLSIKDPTLTIATTHHAPTTITINTTGALADLIDLSCANLPQYASCTFLPAVQDLTATNTSTGTLTFDTDTLLNYARMDSPPGSLKPHDALTAILALSLPTTLLAALTRLTRRRHPCSRRARLPHLLAVLFLSVTALTLSGCSGLYPSHVAPGTYTVTIIGHARSTGVQHSAPLTLVVTP